MFRKIAQILSAPVATPLAMFALWLLVPFRQTRPAFAGADNQRGQLNAGAASGIVGIVLGVIVIVIGIALIAEVVSFTDSAITTASTNGFTLASVIFPFIPVLYIAVMMTVAGAIGAVSVYASGGGIHGLLLTIIAVLIAIAMADTVMTNTATAATAIDAAVNSLTLAAVVVDFLPVIYAAAIMVLIAAPGIVAFNAIKSGNVLD